MTSATSPTASKESIAKPAGRLLAAAVAAAVVASLLAAGGASAQLADCPNAEHREGASSHLPGCRAYELVSPVDKNGFPILYHVSGSGQPGGRPASVDGTAIVLASRGAFAGQAHGGNLEANYYIARRTSDGWDTTPIVPRPSPPAAFKDTLFSSTDLGRSLLVSSGTLTSAPSAGNLNVYLLDQPDELELMLGVSDHNLIRPVATPDLEHVVFASEDVLTDDPGVPPAGTDRKVYELVDGEVRLVSIDPDDNAFSIETDPAGGSISGGFPESSVAGGISSDGRHIFFSADDGEIYRRTDATTTTLATPSEVDPPATARDKTFRVATPDGNRLFFTTPQPLTADANPGASGNGRDLYRYDFAADELVALSAIPGADGAQVQGVAGISEAGDRVYYVAHGEVVAGQGTSGQPNLYLWEDDGSAEGRTRFIATLVPFGGVLDPGDAYNWRWWHGGKKSRAAADGRYLLFESSANIPGFNTGGMSQVYRYDASGSGDLLCVSCNPDGAAPLGPSLVEISPKQATQTWEQTRAISEDGQRVFFSSQDALVTGDTNGRFDAYMWEGGDVELLSTGTSEDDSHFYNASADGEDAFFLTSEALVAQDRDNLTDLYDARVGGGFPAPPPEAGCSGEACQGTQTPAPAPRMPASAALRGPAGSPGARRSARRVRVLTVSRRQRARLAHGRRVGIRVRVNRAGPIRVVLRARIGKRVRTVARGGRRASSAGTARVRLRLSRPARVRLARGRPLRVVLRARVRGDKARSKPFTLRRAGR